MICQSIYIIDKCGLCMQMRFVPYAEKYTICLLNANNNNINTDVLFKLLALYDMVGKNGHFGKVIAGKIYHLEGNFDF